MIVAMLARSSAPAAAVEVGVARRRRRRGLRLVDVARVDPARRARGRAAGRGPRRGSPRGRRSRAMMPTGAGVGEDPLDLLGGGGLVDRDGHGAGGPDREVGEGPLVAGLAHDGRRGRRARCRRRSGPWPAPRRRSANSAAVTSIQPAPSLREKATRAGLGARRPRGRSARLPSVVAGGTRGVDCSCTCLLRRGATSSSVRVASGWTTDATSTVLRS